MLTAAMGSFLGHDATTIKQVLLPLREALADEIFQTGYSAERLLILLAKRLETVKTQNEHIDRLGRMTVS